LLSVDGTHCLISEPSTTGEFSKDPTYYSHKHNHAGLGYEIGISLFTSQVVWVNGPFPAGENDISVYKNRGLCDMIPEGHWVIADNGYRGVPTQIQTSNSLDKKSVKLLKRRAKAQHEQFNSRLKNFAVLRDCWHNEIEYHGTVFDAVCVICQYQMENGSPLFDV
jgi:hypothetical protein